MPKRNPIVFAYVVVAVTRKHDPSIDVSHAPAPPKIGDIVVFEQHEGDVVIREEDHEVLVDIIHLHLLCRGAKLPDGNIDFEYEGKRLLALVKIGSDNERTLHAEIDRVFDMFESALGGFQGVLGDDAVERMRKDFA